MCHRRPASSGSTLDAPTSEEIERTSLQLGLLAGVIPSLDHRGGPTLRCMMPLEPSEALLLEVVLQQISHAEALSESVVLVNESTLNAHLSVLNNRMNDVMKVLTVFGVIFLPLNFLTGLYGTNFTNLPSAHNPYGFWVLLGIAAGVVLSMATLFYRLGWFRRQE